MEVPPVQQKGVPPASSGGAVEAHKVVKKQIRAAAKRMNFWVPSSLYRRLEDEAEKEGMTMGAWVQLVLLKRPERVIERTLLPAGTGEKLKQIPVLEKQLAEQKLKNQADVKDYNALLKKYTMALKVLDEAKTVKCPGCKKTVQLDFTEDVKRIRELK
jgi:hypothetical protein